MQTPWLQHYKHIIILFGIGIIAVVMNVDFTAVNLALVEIAQQLHVNLKVVQWMLSGYVLAWAASVVPAGRLADSYGHRRICLLGLNGFLLGSVITGFAASASIAIFGRVVQGVSSALFLPPLYALVYTNYPLDRRGFAIGMIGTAAGFGLAIGPPLGGFILEHLNWRWLFFINIPLCLVATLVLSVAIEKQPSQTTTSRVPMLLASLFALTIVLFILALHQINGWGVNLQRFSLLMGADFFCLISFLILHKRSQVKLIPRELLNSHCYIGCVLINMLVSAIYSSTLLLSAIFLQVSMGYTAYQTGIIMLVMSMTYAVISPLGGRATDYYSAYYPIVAGFTLVIVAGLIMCAQSAVGSLIAMLIGLTLFGIGIGFVFAAINVAMLRHIDEALLGAGSSVFSMAGLVGNTINIILSTLSFQRFVHARMTDFLHSHHTLLGLTSATSFAKQLVVSVPDHVRLLSGLQQVDQVTFKEGLSVSAVYGFKLVMLVNIVIAIAAILICYYYFIYREKQPVISTPIA